MDTVTLDSWDEIMGRLSEIDESHMAQYLFPVLARHGGHEKSGPGLVLMFTMDLGDYLTQIPPVAQASAKMLFPFVVTAVLGEGSPLLAETLAALRSFNVVI